MGSRSVPPLGHRGGNDGYADGYADNDGAGDSSGQPRFVDDRIIQGVTLGLDLGQKHDPSAVVVCEVGERFRRPQTSSSVPGGVSGTGVSGGAGEWVPPPPAFHDPGVLRLALDEQYRRGGGGGIGAKTETTYRAQYMKRLDLGTNYISVARHVADLLASLYEWEKAQRSAGNPLLPPTRRLSVDLYVDATGVGGPVVDLLKRALADEPRAQRCVVHAITFTHGDMYLPETGRLGKAYLVSRLQTLFQEGTLDLPKHDPEAPALMKELLDYEIHIDSNANDTYGAFKVGSYDDLVTALGLACLDDPAYNTVRVAPFSLWP